MKMNLELITTLAQGMLEAQTLAVREALYDQMLDCIGELIDLSDPGETDIRSRKNGQRLWLRVVVNPDRTLSIETFNSTLQPEKVE
jgi:hypothetical protein